MKFSNVKTVGHNIAAPLASGIGLMIGTYEMNLLAEASAASPGFIEVDFIPGHNAGTSASESLRAASLAPVHFPEIQMKRLTATLLFLVSFAAMSAFAQKTSLKEQIHGTWIHVSTTVTAPDGKKTDRPGQGVVIYAPDGYFAFVNVANDLPKLAANNRDKATVEEAKAIVAGSIAYYGTYTVDEGTRTIIPTVEGATFPNMVGTDQSRIVTSIAAAEMRFTNPKAPAGVLEIVWRRAK